MKPAKEIFDTLQAEHGNYGRYVLLQKPNCYSETTYRASAATLELIEELQRYGYTDDGYPDAVDCGYLEWQIVTDQIDGDESNACCWAVFEAYDEYGRFVENSPIDLE